jgi:ammonia channel protein AmtB
MIFSWRLFHTDPVQAIKSGFMLEIYLPFGRWFWGRQRALGAANFKDWCGKVHHLTAPYRSKASY